MCLSLGFPGRSQLVPDLLLYPTPTRIETVTRINASEAKLNYTNGDFQSKNRSLFRLRFLLGVFYGVGVGTVAVGVGGAVVAVGVAAATVINTHGLSPKNTPLAFINLQ